MAIGRFVSLAIFFFASCHGDTTSFDCDTSNIDIVASPIANKTPFGLSRNMSSENVNGFQWVGILAKYTLRLFTSVALAVVNWAGVWAGWVATLCEHSVAQLDSICLH